MTQSAQKPAPKAAPSVDAEHPPIDMEHLLHYTMGDAKLAREVLGLFSTQGRIYLEQLSQTSEPKERKIAAHTLKGSAKSVGAHGIAGMAHALETMAATQDHAAWSLALSELKAAFTHADSFIADLS